ncbi:hypothetical protein BD310DRAFT_922193 [Dichomitus squalens]|uniref:Uncharacterized protein n=1 Tax=Dichomitus squalens TaxID=114155 RepID=A0A4V2K8P8_9APHY|nr:hypothetical protein BD310DRAFT_922193 [Dichomitus squalens]
MIIDHPPFTHDKSGRAALRLPTCAASRTSERCLLEACRKRWYVGHVGLAAEIRAASEASSSPVPQRNCKISKDSSEEPECARDHEGDARRLGLTSFPKVSELRGSTGALRVHMEDDNRRGDLGAPHSMTHDRRPFSTLLSSGGEVCLSGWGCVGYLCESTTHAWGVVSGTTRRFRGRATLRKRIRIQICGPIQLSPVRVQASGSRHPLKRHGHGWPRSAYSSDEVGGTWLRPRAVRASLATIPDAHDKWTCADMTST